MRVCEAFVRKIVPDRIGDVLDEAVVEGEAGHGRQVTLGDAEGHVLALDVAPFGDDIAIADHQPRAPFPALDRAKNAEVRLAAEAAFNELGHVVWIDDGIVLRQLHGGGELLTVHAHGFRGPAFPFSRWRKIQLLGENGLGCQRQQQRREQHSSQFRERGSWQDSGEIIR